MNKQRFEPYREKLLNLLDKKGIKFAEGKEEDKLQNVVFYSKNYSKAIRKCEFYRESGIYSYKVENGNEFYLKPMDDNMFYLGWIRSIVEYSFKDKT